MTPTRNGKIARLPKCIRDDLNRRLEDGEQGKQLVEWLNGLPQVREILEGYFNGHSISEQNLSQWKQGGYADWLKHQETCDLVQRVAEQAEDLEASAKHRPLSDCLAPLLALELKRVSETLLKETTDPHERWQRLRELLQEIGQLRRDDHQAARLRMDQADWNHEQARIAEEKYQADLREEKRELCAPVLAQLEVAAWAPLFGGGEAGHKIGAFLVEVQKDLPPGSLTSASKTAPVPSSPVQPNQSESNPIKPNQTSACQ